MPSDLRLCGLDPLFACRYLPHRSEQPERLSQGTEEGTPGKAVRPTGCNLVVRSGRLTGCAIGVTRKAPKPNERVYPEETETAARGCSEHLSPRG